MPDRPSTPVGSAVVKRLLSLLVASTLVLAACGSSSDAAFSVEPITVTVGDTPAAGPIEEGAATTTTTEGESEGGEEIDIPAVEVPRSSVDGQLDDIAESDEFVAYVESSGGAVLAGDGRLDSDYVAQYLSDRVVFEIIEADFENRGLELTDEDREAGRAELASRLAPAPDPSLPAGEQVTSQATSGVGRPLASTSPTARTSCSDRLPASTRTMSVSRIWPPVAASHRRAASTTGAPNQSPFSKVASPALNPTRISRLGPPPVRFCRSTLCCMATAPAMASAAFVVVGP